MSTELQQSLRRMYPDLDLERAAEEADSRSTLSLPYVHHPLSGIWALAVTGSLPAT